MPTKPLNRKAYGSIGHLPGSRMGSGDHSLNKGQGDLLTVDSKGGKVIVQEKLDGSCMSVVKHKGEIIALSRAGYKAISGKFYFQKRFAYWVANRYELFDEILEEGERIVGEWLVLAHGTIYKLPHSPFVPFDIFRDEERVLYEELVERLSPTFPLPTLLSEGDAISIFEVEKKLGDFGFHGAGDKAEGAVYRIERKQKSNNKVVVDFLGKYVRIDKVDGKYLVGLEDSVVTDEIWNGFVETVKEDGERDA